MYAELLGAESESVDRRSPYQLHARRTASTLVGQDLAELYDGAADTQ